METLEICRTCGASLSPDIEWCGQCYTPVRITEPADDVIVVPDADEGTILPKAATDMSVWAKSALTALIVGFGVLAFLALQDFMDVAGSTAWAFTLFFLVSYAAVAIVVLALTWRPARRAASNERVIVVDGPAAPQVERRQQAFRRSQDPGDHASS